MMAVRRVVTTWEIHDEQLWEEGHLISNWSKVLSESITRHTKAEAPINKRAAPTRGQLAANIDSRRSRAGGLRNITINVTSRAPYSEYVIFGTDTIRSSKGMVLPGHYVGKGRNSATTRWVGKSFVNSLTALELGLIDELPKQVSGQPANDFMTRGIDKASIRHPALRG